MSGLRAKFKPGDTVRWHAMAFTKPEERCGWVVQRMTVSTGLRPCYAVWNAVTGERGDATEDELEGPISIGVPITTPSGRTAQEG